MPHLRKHKVVDITETVGAYKAIDAARAASRHPEKKNKKKDKPLTRDRGLDLVRAGVRDIERPQRVMFRRRGNATSMSVWRQTPKKSS